MIGEDTIYKEYPIVNFNAPIPMHHRRNNKEKYLNVWCMESYGQYIDVSFIIFHFKKKRGYTDVFKAKAFASF